LGTRREKKKRGGGRSCWGDGREKSEQEDNTTREEKKRRDGPKVGRSELQKETIAQGSFVASKRARGGTVRPYPSRIDKPKEERKSREETL